MTDMDKPSGAIAEFEKSVAVENAKKLEKSLARFSDLFTKLFDVRKNNPDIFSNDFITNVKDSFEKMLNTLQQEDVDSRPQDIKKHAKLIKAEILNEIKTISPETNGLPALRTSCIELPNDIDNIMKTKEITH